MSLQITQVDAFTDKPFGGNPAAVCILPEARDAQWMQNVALEMNLSETAFVVRQQDGFDLRWFTPSIEVDLCGHATLASVHVLWEEGALPREQQARFHTRSGLLTADFRDGWIELDFPAKEEKAAEAPPQLTEALGVKPIHVGRNQFDYLVEVSEAELTAMRPNHSLLKTLPVSGIIATSVSTDPRYDFLSRFFAPGSGIDEDPVTGSAHTALTPYWSKKLGKTQMTARQCSPRGGLLRVTLRGARVIMAGQAITVMRGELFV